APADRVPGCRLSADAAQGREPAPADLRAVDLSNSRIGRLTDTALAAGFTPAATLSSASVSRCVWQTSSSIRTVYRNGSSPIGHAERAMRQNQPGIPSYSHPWHNHRP